MNLIACFLIGYTCGLVVGMTAVALLVLLSLGGVIAANIFIVIFIWVKFLRQGRFFDGK
jgi:hypothetical protein